MNVIDISSLKSIYSDWNKENIHIEKSEDFFILTTPFVDNHHDFLQVILRKDREGKFHISDDGYTLSELNVYEIDIKKSDKRKEFFNRALNSFGVKVIEGELTISFSNVKDYPKKMLNLLQCILRISDMLLTSRSTVTSIFFEEVLKYFNSHDVYPSADIPFYGKTGNSHNFDFVINRSRFKKEKIIKLINKPTTDNYKYPLLSFIDISESRSESEFFVITNNIEIPTSPKLIESFTTYDIKVLEWSNRSEWINTMNPTIN